MHPLCGVSSRLKKVVIRLQLGQDDEVFLIDVGNEIYLSFSFFEKIK